MEVLPGHCCDDLERGEERRRINAWSPKILLLPCQHHRVGAGAKVEDVTGEGHQ